MYCVYSGSCRKPKVRVGPMVCMVCICVTYQDSHMITASHKKRHHIRSLRRNGVMWQNSQGGPTYTAVQSGRQMISRSTTVSQLSQLRALQSGTFPRSEQLAQSAVFSCHFDSGSAVPTGSFGAVCEAQRDHEGRFIFE